jgi:hypothetical protein
MKYYEITTLPKAGDILVRRNDKVPFPRVVLGYCNDTLTWHLVRSGKLKPKPTYDVDCRLIVVQDLQIDAHHPSYLTFNDPKEIQDFFLTQESLADKIYNELVKQ